MKFEVDPITWHRKSRSEQQDLELCHIRRKLLKGAMLALSFAVGDRVKVEYDGTWWPGVVTATNGETYEIHYDDPDEPDEINVPAALIRREVEPEGLDAVRLTLLRGRYPGLKFKRAPSFGVGDACGGRFSAQFMDRGVVEMVIDHIGLRTVPGKDGKLYREVGFRGLLPEDENRYASGYEWMTILGLEEYCRDYLAKPLYKTGHKTDHGEVVAAAFAKKYGPDPFQWKL